MNFISLDLILISSHKSDHLILPLESRVPEDSVYTTSLLHIRVLYKHQHLGGCKIPDLHIAPIPSLHRMLRSIAIGSGVSLRLRRLRVEDHRQSSLSVAPVEDAVHQHIGAAVTLLPVLGHFDAQVEFEVSNPAQGTTFEIAAIGIDPGHFNIDNQKLDSRTVNLTFDVHGAPPYASSERDQDDGFRIGWNNGYNLTQIDSNWNASSANMYNKYGRDVGSGKKEKDNPRGLLRLVRHGHVFCSFYKDIFNDEWVCSGADIVPNIGNDVHIRIAAKHWNKDGSILPGNKIVFRNFRLYQY
jgi:hypothetical protein